MYLPTPQRWHALVPVALEYVPAAQSVQVLSPPLEYVPAAQSMQVLFEEAPTVSENVPAAQATQVLAAEAPTAEETAEEYLPATHSSGGGQTNSW